MYDNPMNDKENAKYTKMAHNYVGQIITQRTGTVLYPPGQAKIYYPFVDTVLSQ